MFGDWIDAVLASNVFSYQLAYFCCFLFLARMWRSVFGPSDQLWLQALINYGHVSSAQSPPSLPPLCDTGHIIILTSNKNGFAILVVEEFLLPSVSRLYQASLQSGLRLNAQNDRENPHLWWMCWCFFVACEEEERMGTSEDLPGADWHHKAGSRCLYCERSCSLIRNYSLS